MAKSQSPPKRVVKNVNAEKRLVSATILAGPIFAVRAFAQALFN